MSARAKKQHVVPQFLLRNFSFNRGTQLYAFDKQTDREFIVSVRDAAAQNGFYEFELGQGSISLEQPLAQIESSASRVIGRIVATESLSNLTVEDRATLALFVCIQLNRSHNWRLMQGDLSEKLRERARRVVDESGGTLPDELLDESGDEVVALLSIASAHEFVPFILQKPWVLQKVSGASLLQISDSPLTLHNMVEFGPYGNLGVAVPGVELQLPLSSRLNLWMMCPTLYAKFADGYETAIDLKRRLGRSSPAIDQMVHLIHCIREGNPTELSEQNVVHYNSLQVRFSARFLYSYDGDYSVVKQMIGDNDKYRSGIRFET